MRYYHMAFIPAREGGFAILSPDFDEVASQGETLEECMDMAADALRIVTEEYAKTGRNLPAPCGPAKAKENIARKLEELEATAAGDIVFQMVAAPEANLTPVKISATFTRRTLDIIDAKAKRAGMTRSGFLAAAAQAYT